MNNSVEQFEVFSPGEIARAAGASRDSARQLIARGEVGISTPGEYLTWREAVRAVRMLMAAPAEVEGIRAVPPARAGLFEQRRNAAHPAAVPLIVSSTCHAALLAAIVFVTTLGLTPTSATTAAVLPVSQQLHLVYLALPGPGGGGGGGGLRQKVPPPQAERQGRSKLTSPLPVRQPPRPIVPVEQPKDAPKPAALEAEQLPVIEAPVAVSPADVEDRAGVLEQTSARADSRGTGDGGGVGTGMGTGIGDGQGSGVGPGSGGGTGGGPYRPGSGIEPPRLLHEQKPDYTEDARQRGIEGDVVLEIVVRRDGSVGDVHVLQSLGAGLDQRAAQAVRQWRFAPARRLGTPVDVIVEVAVEFHLR